MTGLAVVGTDTGVGKTLITRALLTLLHERGLRPAGFKPCETGCDLERPGPGEDAPALLLASGAGDALSEVCPYRFLRPLAPAEAARLEGRQVELAVLLAAYQRLAQGRPVVVEGAGGLLVPLAPGLTFADLLQRLGLPCLVVARDGLGTLNHTALTVEALRSRGLQICGVVLNAPAPGNDGTRASNAEWIEQLTGLPVLARVGHQGPDLARLQAAREGLSRKFDALFGRR